MLVIIGFVLMVEFVRWNVHKEYEMEERCKRLGIERKWTYIPDDLDEMEKETYHER